MRQLIRLFVVVLALLSFAPFARAQATHPDSAAVIAVADSVLAALSTSDGKMLAHLTLDSAVVGGVGLRNGVERASLRTWGIFIQPSEMPSFTERGFGATARVQDRVATVWMPYDLYVGESWSHCGVDTFTLMRTDGRWRVAALIYTIEQPPACRKHPAGPPTH